MGSTRITAIIFGIFLAAFLAAQSACAGPGPIRVTFLAPFSPKIHTFWSNYVAFMEKAAEDLGIELTVVNGENRFSVLNNAKVVLARANKPDYLVYIYHAQNTLETLRLAEKAGVKSVIVNTDVVPDEVREAGGPREIFSHWIGHISPNDEQAGRMLATRLIETGRELGLTDNDGILHVIAVGASKDITSSNFRIKGMADVIMSTPKTRLDRLVWANWLREKAYSKTLRLLNMYYDSRVYWGVHDDTALGILDAALQEGFTPGMNFITGGMDWTPAAIAAVKDGRMDALIGGHFMGGAWAMIMIYDYHHGADFADMSTTLTTHMRLMDRSNYATYIPTIDQANWDRIDFRRFTRTHSPDMAEYNFSPDAVVRQLNGN